MYCKHCGKDTEEPLSPPQPTEEVKKKIPIWFKALLAVVALTIGGFLLNTFLAEDLTDTVRSQLQAIRQGNLDEAYYAYSSKKFQEATSFENFSEFIKKHPAFSENQSIHFKERNVNNDIGTLDSVMVTNHGKKILVEYKLVKEFDEWRILSIRLEDKEQNSDLESNSDHSKIVKRDSLNSLNSLKFNQMVLGTTLSPLGLVKTPSNHFNTNSGDIYLNLYITDAQEGAPIRVSFEHLDSHSALNLIKTRTARDGEAILSFVFSPPKGNWPSGNYRINALSAPGIKKSIDFKIE